MPLFARIGSLGLPFILTTLVLRAAPVLAQEEGQVPGAIPDPSTYQGSMEQQRQSDEQDQQFREQMQQQQQQQQYEQRAQPRVQGSAPQTSDAQGGTHQASKAPLRQIDPKTDTAANAIKRGDFTTALRLARPKALGGDAAAQHVLGFLYETGNAVPLNYEIAASWNRKAADQGNAGGQADLGWMYFKGLGVPRDPVQAYKWLVLAGREDATARRHMQEVQAAITYDQMSQGLSLAQLWSPAPAKH
ncbi:MAG: tetratricopeptide repeat protein [Sphingomonas sp.]